MVNNKKELPNYLKALAAVIVIIFFILIIQVITSKPKPVYNESIHACLDWKETNCTIYGCDYECADFDLIPVMQLYNSSKHTCELTYLFIEKDNLFFECEGVDLEKVPECCKIFRNKTYCEYCDIYCDGKRLRTSFELYPDLYDCVYWRENCSIDYLGHLECPDIDKYYKQNTSLGFSSETDCVVWKEKSSCSLLPENTSITMNFTNATQPSCEVKIYENE